MTQLARWKARDESRDLTPSENRYETLKRYELDEPTMYALTLGTFLAWFWQ